MARSATKALFRVIDYVPPLKAAFRSEAKNWLVAAFALSTRLQFELISSCLILVEALVNEPYVNRRYQ